MGRQRVAHHDEVRLFNSLISPPAPYPTPFLFNSSREAYCDMKIKEKGLTGKAAQLRRETISTTSRKFNAFRDMSSASKEKEKEKEKDNTPKEIYLEFMGSKIKVYTEDGVGTVKEEDVPYVKGATMKFEGCGGDLSFPDIKVSLTSTYEGSKLDLMFLT
jgi:lupus La protein